MVWVLGAGCGGAALWLISIAGGCGGGGWCDSEVQRRRGGGGGAPTRWCGSVVQACRVGVLGWWWFSEILATKLAKNVRNGHFFVCLRAALAVFAPKMFFRSFGFGPFARSRMEWGQVGSVGI